MDHQALGNWRILIVDDDEEDYLITRSMLKEIRGNTVVLDWVATYEAGQDKIRSQTYDAVLVGYNLAPRTGLDFIRETLAQGYPAPLILYTGHGRYEVDIEAMQAGASLYLDKGEVTPALLERSLRYAISQKSRQNELNRYIEENFNADIRSKAQLPDENPNPIFRVSRGGELLYANLPARTLIKHWGIENQHELPDDLVAAVNNVLVTGTPKEIEVECSDIKFLFCVAPVQDQSYVNLYGADITRRKKMEATLRESEERFRVMADGTPVLIWITDGEGKVEFINRACQDFFNRTQEQFQSEGWQPLIHPDDRAGYVSVFVNSLQNHVPFHREGRAKRKDGAWRWFDSYGQPRFSASGDFLGMVGSSLDITDRKQLEEEIQESERKYRELIQYAPVGIYEVDFRKQVFTSVNDVMCLLTGYSREEFLAMNPLEILDEPSQQVFRERIRKWLAGEKPEENVEYRVLAKDGHEIYAVLNVQFIADEYGRPLGATVIGYDITERKKAELLLREINEALSKSEERYRRLVETSPDAIFVHANNHFLFANPAALQLFGAETYEQLAAHTVLELVPQSERQEIRTRILHTLEGDKPPRRETRMLRLDGREVPVEAVTGLVDYQGQAAIQVIIRDITERKQAEEMVHAYTDQLKRSNQALEDFAFTASHDLREPMRKVKAFSERLVSQIGGQLDEQSLDYLTRVDQAAERMQSMLDGLLAYSRVTYQGNPFSDVDLNRLAEEVLYDLELQLKEAGGTVELGDLPTIYADPMQTRQLLQNLIGNAIKFRKPGVPLLVKVTSQPVTNGYVELMVEDNGIGFDMASADQLFKPFHRLVGKSAYEGTGMGLAICQKIVERHHGSISAKGELGEGSTFTVTLPCAPKPIGGLDVRQA